MKKQISYKIVSLVFSVLVVCFAIAFYVVAWNEPAAPPPGGNIPAPLNTGIDGQSKEGGLLLGNSDTVTNGLIVRYGNVGIGTTSPSSTLDIKGTFSLGPGGSGISATGGTITTSGSYTIHTFTSSGTFTPSGAGNVEVLVVAGGGGAGNNNGGGGGAGGVVYNASYAVTAQSYTVTVGDGGAADTNGENSVFGTITSIGGGTGTAPATDGGSGGGGRGGLSQYLGGAGTPGQGNAGGHGDGDGATYATGGGGGGKGAVGADASSAGGGDGGDGSTYSISGSSVTYGGGGGGGGYISFPAGAGGSGGGGDGNTGSGPGGAGTPNTGGGGGGSGYPNFQGGAGGSGIVIIRYSASTVLTVLGQVHATEDICTDAGGGVCLSTGGSIGAFGDWTNLDSTGGTLVKEAVYKATTDGFVTAYITPESSAIMYGYTDISNPPMTLRFVVESAHAAVGNPKGSLTMPVRKNDYWRITGNPDAGSIYWLPIGSGASVRQ